MNRFQISLFGVILMPKIDLFCEDIAHENFMSAFFQAFIPNAELHPVSMRGGSAKAITEAKKYLRFLSKNPLKIPDYIVLVIDGNCMGHSAKRRLIESQLGDFITQLPSPVIYAIPDPHIERWCLLDGRAFKSAFGKGCNAPDGKCDRGTYKLALLTALRTAGIESLLGGADYLEEVVPLIEINKIKDPSFLAFISDLHQHKLLK